MALGWARNIRSLFCEYFVTDFNPIKVCGTVEVDDSLFGRKYHRGKPIGMKIWIGGLAERETNRIELFPVDNQSEATLTVIIMANVAPGSAIYADG